MWLIYATIQQAQEALNYINSTNWFPADNGLTTQWCDKVTETVFGFGFPAIPSERIEANSIPESEVNLFFATFPNVEVKAIEATDIVGGE